MSQRVVEKVKNKAERGWGEVGRTQPSAGLRAGSFDWAGCSLLRKERSVKRLESWWRKDGPVLAGLGVYSERR